MCGDMLSSSWESEQRKNNITNFDNPKNNWMKPEVKTEIKRFQDDVVYNEFKQAVDEHRVEEVYWVGGEPLMFEEHWEFMKQIVKQGDGSRVYARYNTNLSRTNYKGVDLVNDILAHLRDWQICASIDGTGQTGEYIRTGLKYNEFIDNYKKIQSIQTNPRQMRLDFTLTLPGLFEIENMVDLSNQLNTTLLSKVVFAFTPDIVMSPLCLPKEVLHRFVNRVIEKITPKIGRHNRSIIDVLNNLLTRKTFEEEWPDSYKEGIQKGIQRIKTLEFNRKDTYTFGDILNQDKEIYEWWQSQNT